MARSTAALVAAGARVVAVELHPGRVADAARALRRRAGDRRRRRHRRPPRLPRRPFRVVANPPWARAETVRASLLRSPALVRADLVLPRWLVRRWAARLAAHRRSARSLRAESFRPPAPTGSAVAVRPRPPRCDRPVPCRPDAVEPPPPVRLRHAAAGPAALAVPRAVRRSATARRRWPAGSTTPGYGWPVAAFGRRPPTTCPGTLVDLDRGRGSTRRSPVLDDVEADGDRPAPPHRRHDDGRASARWAYHCDRPAAAMVRIDRWTASTSAEPWPTRRSAAWRRQA